MITIIRSFIVIIMLILLVVQIYTAIKGNFEKSLLICLVIQILNLINLIVRCFQ